MAMAVTSYSVWLALHILVVAIWVGGAFALQLFAIRATRSGDPNRIAAITSDAEFIGGRVFGPASLAAAILGFVLVSEQDWSFDFWLVFGIAAWAASAITGSAFLGPESGRVNKLVEAHGAEAPEVSARVRRIFLVARVDLVILMLVVLDMAIKPGL
jgi:uncharacterized membrane protein